MFQRLVLIVSVSLLVSCVSSPPTPTSVPPPTLPIATGIPVTPRPVTPRARALPTATVETLPTPKNVKQIFGATSAALKAYHPPDSDPKLLYDALAKAIADFLTATSNSDVSLEGQHALDQLRDALGQVENLPQDSHAQVAAMHLGEDQGGSRDLVFVALQGVMGLPIVGVERVGASYTPLPPTAFHAIAQAQDRNFYPAELDTRDMTQDGTRELIYVIQYPGASGVTNELTVARWLGDKQELNPIFHAALINWAGESDYEIQTTADASSIKLTFPWFGAFDHKLLAHPTATQNWEYDDKQDLFVRVSQSVDNPKTPREALNAGEYAFRNGDLQGAVASYERAWNDATLQPEDFGDSKADPKAFAKFREAMVLGLLGRDNDAKNLLTGATKSQDALATIAKTYSKNLSAGSQGVLRSWVAMASAGDLYKSIYDGKAGNLDFPFDASEIYFQGGIVSALLNLNGDLALLPDALWGTLDGLNFKSLQHTAVDLNGDGTNEFLVVTHEGGSSPNQSQRMWFIYHLGTGWRARALDIADTVQLEGDAVPLPNGKGKAIKLKLPNGATPNEIALTWQVSPDNGAARIVWLDAKTLTPTIDNWTSVGGGPLQDDF